LKDYIFKIKVIEAGAITSKIF